MFKQLGKLICVVNVSAVRKDRVWHYEGKKLESSGRKDGNEKGSNSQTGNKKELVHMKYVFAEEVEGLYNGNELETFKEEEHGQLNDGGYGRR
jgi:hypothetical protein